MPTGYTSDLYEGRPVTFVEFALKCARDFGACVSMRDEPLDTPIPEAFEPSPYYRQALEEAEARLATLTAMKLEEMEAAYLQARAKELTEYEALRKRSHELRARYTAMLAQVKAWTPPTPDHQHFKEFMRQQLVESLNFDTGEWSLPVDRGAQAWWEDQVAHAARWRDDAEEAEQKERERVQSRNEWLRDLRESLGER